MHANRLIRRLCGDQRGAMGTWMAMTLACSIGVGAVAVDLGNLYGIRAHLQHTADAAAIAAAQALPDLAAATAAAQSYAEMNMPAATNGTVAAASDIVSGSWNSQTRTFAPNGSPLNAVSITTRRAQANGNAVPTYFARALGFGTLDVSTRAIAYRNMNMYANCIVALNPHAQDAFYVKGNSSVRTFDCNMQINSCHPTAAFHAQGNVDVIEVSVVDETDPSAHSGQINVCGEVSTEGPVNLDPVPTADTGVQVADPFGAVSNPDPALYDQVGDCTHTDFTASGDVDLYPGVYCGGITLTGTGTATFHSSGGTLENGLYIVKDGTFSVARTMAVVGSRVTFFMTGAASNINFGGSANIGLSAPTTGPLAGFVFFGDRDHPASAAHSMRGTALGGYDGFIYLPGAKAVMSGTATGTTGATDCTVVVADRFEFSGTPNFEAKAGCTDFGGLTPAGVALVN